MIYCANGHANVRSTFVHGLEVVASIETNFLLGANLNDSSSKRPSMAGWLENDSSLGGLTYHIERMKAMAEVRKGCYSVLTTYVVQVVIMLRPAMVQP